MTGQANKRVRSGTVKSPWHAVTPDKAFWLFALFMLLVLLTGGGSRYDISSVGPLRAISALFLAISIYAQTQKSFQKVAPPVSLLIIFGMWMAAQLVPLPPAWWSDLPGREAIFEAGSLVGASEVWRPITLSPLRTLNALASLVAPLATLMLLALLNEDGWRRVPKLIVGAGVASALLGIAQVTLPGAASLYFYEITNQGSAVGFFSNRNHNALFLNIALLISFWRVSREGPRWTPASLLTAAGQLILLLGVLINGSRFGFALFGFVALIFAVRAFLQMQSEGKLGQSRSVRQQMLAFLGGAASLSVIALFVLLDRIPALTRLFEQDVAQDLRARAFATVWQMASDNLLFGVGFGAFEPAYRTVESDALLSSAYFNQAHNDWLQIMIEGGVPAILILCLGLFLIGRRGWSIWKLRKASAASLSEPLLGFLVLIMIGAHSFFDYPLRTPIIMFVAAIAVGWIFRTRNVMGRG